MQWKDLSPRGKYKHIWLLSLFILFSVLDAFKIEWLGIACIIVTPSLLYLFDNTDEKEDNEENDDDDEEDDDDSDDDEDDDDDDDEPSI